MPPRSADLLRFVLLRGIGLLYFVAFVVWWRQGVFLVGSDGLSPAHLFLTRVAARLGDDALTHLPSLFWLDDTDLALSVTGLVGTVLGAAVLCGVTNAGVMAVLWALYVSIVNVGQDWYGYGWETLLCETGFLAIFLCPLGSLSPRGLAPASPVPIYLFRWLTFRILLGAGFIKLRGDPCWRDLTCLIWHYETQPNPHPLSWLFHQMPPWFHALGVLYNHLVELLAPWFVFGPRPARRVAAALALLFQVFLICSGNLAFLNWLTLVIGLSLFDDALLDRAFPRLRAWLTVAPPLTGTWRRVQLGVLATLVALVAWRSLPVVDNLFFAERQAMNRSYDPLHLVNTYGAFGSVGTERFEAVIQGSATPEDPESWLDYELPCKPGDVTRRPCLITPYHLHLDWQMWFIPLQGVKAHVWVIHLLDKLLHGDALARAQFSHDPFPDTPPRAVRLARFHYDYTTWGQPGWWTREQDGLYVRPLTRDDPALDGILAKQGWTR